MRTIQVNTPRFTDRVAEAREALKVADRDLLRRTLARCTAAIEARGVSEQLLHGEPHPGNLLATRNGLRFVDLETCCRGPLEFDLAHVPVEVGERYPGLDHDLLCECRILVLAMITTWRWDRRDQFPNGRELGIEGLRQLRVELGRSERDARG